MTSLDPENPGTAPCAEESASPLKARILGRIKLGKIKSPGGNGVAWLAVVLAAIAVFLSFSDKMSTKNDSLVSINRMMTDSVVPEMKRAREKDMVDAVYDLKHVSVTLEKLRDTSRNPEVKTMIEKLRKDVEEISVKIYVHE
ncbi:MAG: hypothetical protein HZB23_15855 [Deltaproteobacteria bacterium]|nr:hypothetical protein [Deltaproteobacteria bacterium]